jgi:hypothetical protein
MLPRPTQGHPSTAHFVSGRFLFQFCLQSLFQCHSTPERKIQFTFFFLFLLLFVYFMMRWFIR